MLQTQEPKDDPLRSLKLSASRNPNEEILLPAHLSFDFQWLTRLADLSDWQTVEQRNERLVYLPNLLRQSHTLKVGEAVEVHLTPQSNR